MRLTIFILLLFPSIAFTQIGLSLEGSATTIGFDRYDTGQINPSASLVLFWNSHLLDHASFLLEFGGGIRFDTETTFLTSRWIFNYYKDNFEIGGGFYLGPVLDNELGLEFDAGLLVNGAVILGDFRVYLRTSLGLIRLVQDLDIYYTDIVTLGVGYSLFKK